MGSIIAAIGVGLILMNRLAAILFSAFLTFNALELIIVSIIEVPLPYKIINIFMGILMLVPAAATISGWKELKWTYRLRI